MADGQDDDSRGARPHNGADTRPGRRSALTALGWGAAGLLSVIIAVLTVVLAGMLLVVSVWLTVAVPVVVLAAVIALMAYARRA